MSTNQLQKVRSDHPKPSLQSRWVSQNLERGALPNIASRTPRQQQVLLSQEDQSQIFLQELISAVVGCITYLRGLIPENSFCDMTYTSTVNTSRSHSRGASTSQDSIAYKSTRESATRIKSLQRGLSTEADTLLDWIEKGIFCALNKGYLKAFQLAIFLDLDNPDLIQEAYTFSINYRQRDCNGGSDVKEIGMTEIIQNGEICALVPSFSETAQLRRSVKVLIRKLILVTQNLDLLPENRYLTIRLYHTPETPDKWVPPMFTPFSGKPLRYDGSPHKSPSSGVFGRLDTGVHSVQVQVVSAKRTISETQERIVTSANNQSPNKRPRISGKMVANKFIGLNTALEDYVVQPDQFSKRAVHKPDIILKSQSMNEELKNVKSSGQAVLGSRLQ